LHEQLLTLIGKQRQKWAQAWADGNATGDAANRMAQLHRLTSTMADIAEVAHDLEHVEIVNRWSAWMLDPDLIRRPMSDVSSRLKLATAAAVQGDENGLNQQLEKVERDAPLVKLVGKLSAMLGNSLRELPDGAPGVLAEVSVPPGPDAWMLQHRRALADVCRYAMEQEHARANDRAELASSLNEFVAAACNELFVQLREYDERPQH
jgi:hypothetical protein